MRRPNLAVVLLLLAAFLTGGLIAVGVNWFKSIETRSQRQARIETAREERQTAVAEIPPAAPPTALPLVGKDGTDADGYPTQYVDMAALRSLLHHQRHEELTRYGEALQAAFETDPRKEYWPLDIAGAFATPEPGLRPRLDAWVASAPNSFVPYLARGTHWTVVAYARRGTALASKTAREDFSAMDQALKLGLADLDRAITLRPKLVAAMRRKITALMAHSESGKLEQTIEQAIAACPGCFQVRVNYLLTLRPRWGGSYEQMAEFARIRVDPSNPKFRLLPGYIDQDRANALRLQQKYAEALQAIEAACALGEHWDFLAERAEVKERLGNFPGALVDLDRAVAMRPSNSNTRFVRARMHLRLRRWEAAGQDLLLGLRLDPTNETGRRIFNIVMEGLIHEGWQHHTAGRRQDALRVFDLAAELAPGDQMVQSRRAIAAAAAAPGASDEIARLEEATRKAPDDFQAHKQLDTALGQQGRLERAVEIWTAYLARQPKDGRAYLERGGAYFHLRRLANAQADAQKACDLGVIEGCQRAKQAASMNK